MKRSFLLLALIGCASLCVAETQTWQIDPAHTSSQFSVRHLGISTVRGVFQKTTGTVTWDPADPTKTQIDATIDANSVDTRVQMRDNDLRSAHFFDVAKYPTITFKSKHAEVAGAGKLKVTGDLTIHGVTKEVTLDVEELRGPAKDPWGGTRVGATAKTKINRKDFGLQWNVGLEAGGILVGEEVSITIEAEFTQKK